MKAKFRPAMCAVWSSFIVAVYAGVLLLNPMDVHAQNLFVTGFLTEDSTNGFIGEITPDGVPKLFASGLDEPVALAFNSAGNLFVSDYASGTIVEFTPSGVASVFAAGLEGPVGLAFDKTGNLFEADYLSGAIDEFTPGGVKSTFATGLHNPWGLAFNNAGDLFEADSGGYGSGNIYEFTPGGVQSTFASGMIYPSGLAFDNGGELFVSSQLGQVYEVSPNGTKSTFLDLGLSSAGTYGLAFNSAGNLFVAGASGITELTPSGVRIPFAPTVGVPRSQGLAFQGITLPVAEPSVLGLVAVAAAAFLVRRRRLLFA